MTFASRVERLQGKGAWDLRLLALAEHVASWSKDPSTKVGAVIADDLNRVRSLGYNGLARGISDTPERLTNRDLKYPLTIHAELNAILAATASVERCTLFVHPLPPCAACASLIVQRGLRRVVAPKLSGAHRERWAESCELAAEVLEEGGVELVLIDSLGSG